MKRHLAATAISVILSLCSHLIYDYGNVALDSISRLLFIIVFIDLLRHCKKQYLVHVDIPIFLIIFSIVLGSTAFKSILQNEILIPLELVLIFVGNIWLAAKITKIPKFKTLGISFFFIPILVFTTIFFSEFYGLKKLEQLAIFLESIPYLILIQYYFKAIKSRSFG